MHSVHSATLSFRAELWLKTIYSGRINVGITIVENEGVAMVENNWRNGVLWAGNHAFRIFRAHFCRKPIWHYRKLKRSWWEEGSNTWFVGNYSGWAAQVPWWISQMKRSFDYCSEWFQLWYCFFVPCLRVLNVCGYMELCLGDCVSNACESWIVWKRGRLGKVKH